MTKLPHLLSARPDRGASSSFASNPLADVLRVVKLTGAYFQLADALYLPGMHSSEERIISCYILLSGSCRAGVDEHSQVLMHPGDVIVLPREDANLVWSSRDARLVRGVLRCDARQFNPLLSSLPRQLHVTGEGEGAGWLAHLASQLVAESRVMRLGSETMLTRMAELMFIEVLRRYAEELPASQGGWLAGLIDPVVGPALTKLHAQPERGWTLAGLARESASSRSVLTERFTRLVGMPPMCYLKRWRLQLAAEELTRGTSKVSSVGARVGYESEAAFSRAFKQETGMSPAAWRRAGTTARPLAAVALDVQSFVQTQSCISGGSTK